MLVEPIPTKPMLCAILAIIVLDSTKDFYSIDVLCYPKDKFSLEFSVGEPVTIFWPFCIIRYRIRWFYELDVPFC